MIGKNILRNYYIRRGLAFYIDGLFITFLALIYLFFIDPKGPFISQNDFFYWNSFRVGIFQLIFYFIYFLFMEYFFLTTIGKKILGFRLSQENDKFLFLRMLMRTLVRIIPLNIISIWFNNNQLFWHEKWTSIITKKIA